MVGHTYRERRDIAEGPLRAALRVTRDVRGMRVLVYDDVFTDGLTLNEVARTLRRAGATEVCGREGRVKRYRLRKMVNGLLRLTSPQGGPAPNQKS